MKRLLNTAVCVWLAGGAFAGAATFPEAWQHVQTFTVATGGLTMVAVPDETLNAARPRLDDLRLYDDAGMKFLITSNCRRCAGA